MSGSTLLFIASGVLALLLALAATPLLAAIARGRGLLDMPGGRRIHRSPVPRPGGLAVAVAFGVTVFAFWLFDRLVGGPFLIPEEVRSSRFTLTAVAAAIALLIGLLDDILELRARWQLVGLLVVAAVILAAGVRVESIADPFTGEAVMLSLPLAAIVTTLWIVGMNVSLNFIDGLDGLAAGLAAIAALTLGTASIVKGNDPFVAWMSFTLGAALLGFLVFNFHPARLFLGSTGITFIATLLAVLSIFGGSKLTVALLVLGVPIADAFYVLARRLLAGRSPFAPDRTHFHHRLLDIGLSHPQAVVATYALTILLGAIAVVSSEQAQIGAFVMTSIAIGIAIAAQRSRGEGRVLVSDQAEPSL